MNRAARLGNGFFPGTGDAETLRGLITDLAAATESHGRNPADIEVNAMFGPQMADPAAGVEQFQELGVSRAMVPAFFFAGPDGLDRLAEFAEQAIPTRSS